LQSLRGMQFTYRCSQELDNMTSDREFLEQLRERQLEQIERI